MTSEQDTGFALIFACLPIWALTSPGCRLSGTPLLDLGASLRHLGSPGISGSATRLFASVVELVPVESLVQSSLARRCGVVFWNAQHGVRHALHSTLLVCSICMPSTVSGRYHVASAPSIATLCPISCGWRTFRSWDPVYPSDQTEAMT